MVSRSLKTSYPCPSMLAFFAPLLPLLYCTSQNLSSSEHVQSHLVAQTAVITLGQDKEDDLSVATLFQAWRPDLRVVQQTAIFNKLLLEI